MGVTRPHPTWNHCTGWSTAWPEQQPHHMSNILCAAISLAWTLAIFSDGSTVTDHQYRGRWVNSWWQKMTYLSLQAIDGVFCHLLTVHLVSHLKLCVRNHLFSCNHVGHWILLHSVSALHIGLIVIIYKGCERLGTRAIFWEGTWLLSLPV